MHLCKLVELLPYEKFLGVVLASSRLNMLYIFIYTLKSTPKRKYQITPLLTTAGQWQLSSRTESHGLEEQLTKEIVPLSEHRILAQKYLDKSLLFISSFSPFQNGNFVIVIVDP